MPFIKVNQAHLFYQTYGVDRAGFPPLVLIHGFPSTGQNDWNLVVPLLARNHRVIVPDCRGHGQSENPRRSYSFQELSADIAGLVQALGYSSAHVIGHSNGGNVALVTLLEHPRIVQTAVLQAANAYVSPDLIEREPDILNPDRVQQHNPDLMSQMIALHEPTHGPGYWRELLRMGVEEIISQPNYTPNDLAQIHLPVLVIQGEQDRVNAPAGHAQFIAQNIPDAELWIPANVGHNVHEERLFEWVDRIENFLQRRGDPLNDALYRLEHNSYADHRRSIFEVHTNPIDETSQTEKLQITGQVLSLGQFQALEDLLPRFSNSEQISIRNDVRVLLNEHTPWALVNRTVTDVRKEPRTLSERVTQALLGESLRILEERDEWVRVQLERDGYLGWVQNTALWRCSSDQVNEYQSACNTLVIAEIAQALQAPHETAPTMMAGKLPFGVPLVVVGQENGYLAVRLPGGRQWWLASDTLLPINKRPKPDPDGIIFTLDLFRRFIGIPYLWGGRTPFGYDCSGLAQTFLGFLDVQIPRDADQQFAAAEPVLGTPQPGDLLFFGSGDVLARRSITHVAISLGGDEIIHANGSAWGVSYNSLHPDSPLYNRWLHDNLVGIGRFW